MLPAGFPMIMLACQHRINISRPRACLHCYFRVKTSFGSIAAPTGNPAT